MTDIVQNVLSDKIVDPAYAMRSEMDRNALFELADNIKQHGLINPITVRPKNGGFEVVAGHRRFAALKINGTIQIPCIVRELDDEATFGVMAAENLERADVNIVDEANFIKEYMNKTGKDAAEVGKILRRSEAYVIQRLMIAEMPDYAKTYMKSGDLTLGVALALGQIENETIREKWIHLAVEQGVSVATAQYQLRDYHANKTMYDGIIKEKPDAGAPTPPQVISFDCALTGRRVDHRMGRTFWVSEEAIADFFELVRLYRLDPAATPSTPAETTD